MKLWRAVLLAGAFAATASADLAIQRLGLHQYEDGPLMGSSYEYAPGETAWFSARVTGYKTEPRERERHVKLSWQMRVLDPEAVLLVPPEQGSIEEDLQPEDKDWIPRINVSFLIPSFAPAGAYKIPVAIRDELANSAIAGELSFRVRGEPRPPSSPLSILNFRFLAKETDRFAMPAAVYRPGDTLWVRFDIAGYTLAAKNRFEVNYGLAILAGDPEKEVYAQPEAATESQESFYPQRWVAAGFSVNLNAEVSPGAYTLQVTVRDKLAGTTQVERHPFEIRK